MKKFFYLIFFTLNHQPELDARMTSFIFVWGDTMQGIPIDIASKTTFGIPSDLDGRISKSNPASSTIFFAKNCIFDNKLIRINHLIFHFIEEFIAIKFLWSMFPDKNKIILSLLNSLITFLYAVNKLSNPLMNTSNLPIYPTVSF